MLIKQSTEDTDGSSLSGSEEATFHQSINHLLVVVAILTFVLIALPFSVEAGWFRSFLSNNSTSASFSTNNNPGEAKLLTAANTSDPKGAIGGGDLLVVDGALVSYGLAGKELVAASPEAAEAISLYVVREGDTLSQIAEMFEVTSNTILWANDLKDPTDIHEGDTLVILPIVGVRHIVKPGDTVAKIAKKYQADEDEIMTYNQIGDLDELTVGDTLVIPGGNMHTAASTGGSYAASGGSSSSGLVHPVQGAYTRTQGIHGYNAVDLAGKFGTPIVAAAAGEVIISKASGWNSGYGQYIVIRHANGTQTLYAHLSQNAVGAGQYVSAGEVIGYMGSTGRSTGSHTHFEVRGGKNPF